MTGALPSIHHIADGDRRHQKPGRDQQQLSDTQQGNELPGHRASHHRSQGTAEGHDGKETLALFLGIDVVGKGPELGHDHQIEDPHPEEEHHTDGDAALHQRIEDDQASHEECGDGVEQTTAGKPVSQGAVHRNQTQQQQGLAGSGVRFYFGATARQNECFADRLDDVVCGKEKKHIQGEKHCGPAFARLNVGKEAECAIEGTSPFFRQPASLGAHSHCMVALEPGRGLESGRGRAEERSLSRFPHRFHGLGQHRLPGSAGWTQLDRDDARSHQRWARSSFQLSRQRRGQLPRQLARVLGALLGVLGQTGKNDAIEGRWDLQLTAL